MQVRDSSTVALFSLRAVDQAAVVDWLGRRLLVEASATAHIVDRSIGGSLPSTEAVVGLEEDDWEECRNIPHQSTGLSHDATSEEGHDTGDWQRLYEGYFEAYRVQAGDVGVVAGIRLVALVVAAVFEDWCEGKVHAVGLLTAMDRVAHIHPHIHCHRRGSATHPKQIVLDILVPALFSDLAQWPHDTGLVSSAGAIVFARGLGARGEECGCGCFVLDELEAARCSSPVCLHSCRPSMSGSWGLAGPLVFKRRWVGLA